MKKDLKKILILNIPFLFIWYFADKISWLFRMIDAPNAGMKIYGCMKFFTAAFSNPLPSFHPIDILIGVVGAGLLKLALYMKSKNAKKFRQGVEYGSARWGKPDDIKPYMDDNPEQNIILTQTEGLMLNGKPKMPKYARNKNVLIIGGSGSGKTRFFVEPSAPVRAV